MAQVDAFSPDILNRLEAESHFVTEGVKAVSQFQRFPGPDGLWIAKLGKISWSVDKKLGHLKCTATFIALAYAESGDQAFKGSPIVIRYALKDGKNSTKQDAWDRVFTQLYQCLNCQTAAWGANAQKRLVEETTRLNAEKPAVLIEVKTQENDARYYNANIREVLNNEAVAHLVQAHVELTDTAYQLIDEGADEDSSISESVVGDFAATFRNAEAQIRQSTDPKALTTLIMQQKSGTYLPETLASYDVKTLQDIVLACYIQAAGHDPADFGIKEPTPPALDLNQFTAPASTPESAPFDTGDQLHSMVQSQVIPEEDDDEPVVSPDRATLAVAFVNGLSRDQIKLMLVRYEPQSKFSKSVDTAIYGQQLAEILATNTDPLVAPTIS